MKRMLIVLLVASLLLTVAAPAVWAQEEAADPGLTPDSPFYFLKTWIEKIQLAFTFAPEKKVEVLNKLAEKRVAEARKMIEKGKPELAERCLERYEKHLGKAQEMAEKTKEEKAEEVYERVAEATSKHVEVLERVLEKVPEQAKGAAIKHAIKVSQHGHERALEALQKRIQIREKHEREQEMKQEQEKEQEQVQEQERVREQEQEQVQEQIGEQSQERMGESRR